MSDYGNDSIDMLEGAKRVRTRPASVLGSDGVDGARHGFIEIVGNAVDEATAGYGDKLDVVFYEDGSLSVRDYGRGVPMGYNNLKEKMNWFLIFNELYAGGKYDDYQDELKAITDWSRFDPKDYNYLFSIGLNGLGAASTQYASEYFTVRSHRSGVVTEMGFKEGYPIVTMPTGEDIIATPDSIKEWEDANNAEFDLTQYEPKTEETSEPDGTFIHWKPDAKVFTSVDVKYDWIRKQCDAVAYSSGVLVNIKNEQTGESEVLGDGSLEDYNIQENASNSEEIPNVYHRSNLTHGDAGRDRIYVCKADVSLLITDSGAKDICFHNSIRMKGGAQYSAIRLALSDFFHSRGSEHGVKIKDTDYIGKVGVVVSSYSNIASYKGQTKEEVDDVFIYLTVKDIVQDILEVEYHKGSSDIVSLVDDVINEARIRIQIAEQAKAIREVNKATRTRKLPEKFLPSRNFRDKVYDNSELWIVEGDSAQNSVKHARNMETQAIYAIRGKLTNVLKASLERTLESKEIREIFQLAGTGMEVEGVEEQSFNLEDSRFSKYVIATDADEDGFQIRVLVFCVFWKLAPQIIENGLLYIAQTPKFEFTLANGERHYAVTDEEEEELAHEYAGQITNISRFKGLGQVNPDVLAETTLNPETRRMIQIKLNPADYDLNSVIETLFGRDPFKQRKNTLMEVLGSDVVDMFNDNAEILNLIDKGVYENNVEEVEELV